MLGGALTALYKTSTTAASLTAVSRISLSIRLRKVLILDSDFQAYTLIPNAPFIAITSSIAPAVVAPAVVAPIVVAPVVAQPTAAAAATAAAVQAAADLAYKNIVAAQLAAAIGEYSSSF